MLKPVEVSISKELVFLKSIICVIKCGLWIEQHLKTNNPAIKNPMPSYKQKSNNKVQY